MKEFEVPIEIKGGLRRSKASPRNTKELVTLLNAKPHEDGLLPITPVTYSITDDNGTVSWPHPQLFEVSD